MTKILGGILLIAAAVIFASILAGLASVGSVSYTHLDVYKRQRLNSLVSHELMTVNEKFKSAYANRFKAFPFMGTNKPVKISDARSGILRRLIDVPIYFFSISSDTFPTLHAKYPSVQKVCSFQNCFRKYWG